MTRMRTITEAIQEVKKADPQTAFTQTALRRMIKTGELPSFRAGSKYLVNLDILFDYLNNPTSTQPAQTIKTNGIRPISEKIYN
ncbi:MAG: helix-turn-helix domain-containing protein [Oscillospiraceae bacterium]|nr:helix-turn-helix domain-containing protein [Oscillospiraceae bacterium]